MTSDHLTAILAQRVMGWRVGPDRFLTGERRWLPRWRFRPTERVEDAYRLLERSVPELCSMDRAYSGHFQVRVCLAGVAGEARESSQARAITFAVARAIGIEPDCDESTQLAVERR